VNLGVGGYGVDQSLLRLQYEGMRYEPDLVLAYVPHFARLRHMHANRYGRDKPVFEWEGDALRLTHSPVPDPYAGWAGVAHWLRRHSVAWEFIGRRGETLFQRFGVIEPEPDWRALDDLDWKNEAFFTRAVAMGTRIVLEMDRVARDGGARFALVTQDRHTYGLLADAIAAGIPAIDVHPALRNKRFALPGRLRHLNESGNGVLAWETARFLMQQDLVPREHW